MKEARFGKTSMTLFVIIITLIQGNSCSLFSKNLMKEDSKNLANQLQDIGFAGLFYEYPTFRLDSIWNVSGNPEKLAKIVENEDLNPVERFLAAEILFTKDSERKLINSVAPETLGFLYASALRGSGGSSEEYGIYGNPWGFMSYLHKTGVDGAGPLGLHLIEVGEPALPELFGLLDDSNVLIYEGSRDATLGNTLRFRVKDAAAYYILRIKKMEISFWESEEDRDKEINKLKSLGEKY